MLKNCRNFRSARSFVFKPDRDIILLVTYFRCFQSTRSVTFSVIFKSHPPLLDKTIRCRPTFLLINISATWSKYGRKKILNKRTIIGLHARLLDSHSGQCPTSFDRRETCTCGRCVCGRETSSGRLICRFERRDAEDLMHRSGPAWS